MKMFGIGLTLAVLVDAFLIRSTLVPAFMRLAGDANWWAPGPLRRFHDRFGISEHVDLDEELAELTSARGRSRLGGGRALVSPVRVRARRGEGDKLREEILVAVSELLDETNDESAVSIRAIADRVGVTAPSIYRHFADKDEMLSAVCAVVFVQLTDGIAQAVESASSADRRPRRGRTLLRRVRSRPP